MMRIPCPLLVLCVALTGCGSQRESTTSAAAEALPAPAAAPKPATDSAPPPGAAVDATPVETSERTLQLGDEAIGVKNGEQIVAHYSLLLGIAYSDLDERQKQAVASLRSALPLDNAAGKFNSSQVLAVAKLATIFCGAFVDRERAARQTPQSGITPKLPDLDWQSRKLGKELAGVLYPYFFEIFWGVDHANQPAPGAGRGALDELVDALNTPAGGDAPRQPGLAGVVLGICVATATSFGSVEL